MEQEFTEFSEFRESDKSPKHELGSIVLLVLWYHPGLLHKRWLGGKFEPFYCNDKYFSH